MPPNPKRVAAGRLNRAKRKALTAAGVERLREAALTHRPWEHSTGPRTPAGKVRSAANGKARQQGLDSVRSVKQALAEVRAMLREFKKWRQKLAGS